MESEDHTLTPPQRGLDRVAQAHSDFVVDNEPVDDRLDRMARFRVEPHASAFSQLDQCSIDASADEAFAGEALDDVAKLALLIPHPWGEEKENRPGRAGEGAGRARSR